MKKIMLFFIVTFFGFIGCGKPSDHKTVKNDKMVTAKQKIEVDPEFLEYVNFITQKLVNFEVTNSQLQKIKSVSIRFGEVSLHKNTSVSASNDTSKKAIGSCEKPRKNKKIESREITIDLSNWTSLSREMKMNLIAHELGHCAWNLKHIETENKVMSPVVSAFTEDEWKYFAEQIKNSNE